MPEVAGCFAGTGQMFSQQGVFSINSMIPWSASLQSCAQNITLQPTVKIVEWRQ